MKNKKLLVAATAMLLAVLCFWAGCKTTVPVSYTEPARLDMSGVSRIAIDSDNSQVATSISEKISATGKYTVASATELSEWKQWKRTRQGMEELFNYQAQAIEVSAADLVGTYAGNAVRADNSYGNKTLKVTAVVKEIGVTGDSYFVRLEGSGNDSVDVFFVSSETNRLASVDKGQTITVIGEGRGYNRPDLQDTAEILRILGAGRSVNIVKATFPIEGLQDYPGAVDAVITLKTTSAVQDDSRTDSRPTVTDATGKTIYQNVRVYERSVTVNVGYEVVRARDSFLIGQGTTSGTSSKASSEDSSKLPSAADLVARTIGTLVNGFLSQIVPTQRTLSITLAKESDNKEAKKAMGDADKLVKAKNYTDAAAAYGSVYARYKNFAAGYNQAVLTEVASGTEAAVGLMEALAKATGNAEAQRALSDMQSRNASNQRAAAQLAQQD
ncbi:MAG: OB-fold putative lipoprotein [Treponema sp.]|jgi:hypothetical protein|nr:OB-fold putative lipoprotein [Treponema sp.]